MKIAFYYATESMLVWDATHKNYNEKATPEFGSDTLENYYKSLILEDQEQSARADRKLFI